MKKYMIILLILLIITNLVWLFIIIDQSVTLDYIREENKHLSKRVELIKNLANDLKSKETKSEIIMIIEEKYKNHLIKEDEDAVLFIDDVGITFENNHFNNFVLFE
jgi:hypothetical protein